ncbi:MAG TPA: arylsulfatase, partial [Armatimonadota bacterium]|nr:arylsulfatase [Armatimonadota bacterium]
DEGLGYSRWAVEHAFVFVPIQSLVGELVETFKEFPPRQRAASYSVDQVLEQLKTPVKLAA